MKIHVIYLKNYHDDHRKVHMAFTSEEIAKEYLTQKRHDSVLNFDQIRWSIDTIEVAETLAAVPGIIARRNEERDLEIIRTKLLGSNPDLVRRVLDEVAAN